MNLAGWQRALILAALFALPLPTALWSLDYHFPLPLEDTRGASVVLDQAGTPLRAFAERNGVWRYPVTPAQVSPLYLEALLGYEDRWFGHHPGVNPLSMLRALGQALWYQRSVSGASTLTMQVARLIDPVPRSLRGKLKQSLRALQLEWHLSKDEILTLYLNQAPFGGNIEGIEAASWAWLGTSSAELSHAEAALLAVLPQAPSRLRPDRHPQRAMRARDKVIARMVSQGRWPQSVLDDAAAEPVVARSLQAPAHASLLARRLVRDQRAPRIDSLIEIDLQRHLEARLEHWIERFPEGTSAAILVMENANLEVRAYLGSSRFGDPTRAGHVDMVAAWRSPGSTLKPFLYGLALDDGLIHSESLLLDVPQSISGYRPSNFEGRFRGLVSSSEALRLSLNIPAVDLLDRIGSERFMARLGHAGLNLRLPPGSAPNLSVILGGGAVRLEDLVGAYAALQRGGMAGYPRLRADAPMVERRLLSPGAAWIVRDMLENQPRPGLATRSLDAGGRRPVAWKTGTSYGFRDSWALGGRSDWTVGVWVGRPDGTPLPGHYGAVTALPLLLEIVDALPERRAAADALRRPDSVLAKTICWPSGLAADSHPEGTCHRRHEAWVLEERIPPTLPERDARRWSPHLVQLRVHPQRGTRLAPDCDHPDAVLRSYAHWPDLARPWLDAGLLARSEPPPLDASCDQQADSVSNSLRIAGVDQGNHLSAPSNRSQLPQVGLRALGARGEVLWLVNGVRVGKTLHGATLMHRFSSPGDARIVALADDGSYDAVEVTVMRARGL